VAAPRPWFDRPTTLERDIMGMIALGYSDQQIAQEVRLSKVAVRLRMLRLAKRWRFQEIRQRAWTADDQRTSRVGNFRSSSHSHSRIMPHAVQRNCSAITATWWRRFRCARRPATQANTPTRTNAAQN
jgi:hypothetical protein